VRVTYRVFGDRIDGTYLAIDSTHAHINMPAALMWAKGLELRPATVRFEPPTNVDWRVATQLLPGPDTFTFTAPNLQYLMDSPSELSAHGRRMFSVTDGTRTPVFRLAVHHDGSEADLDSFAGDVEKLVREARSVYGEYPAFEGNTYTFIADYLPWANGDGMEHRNSTIVTTASSIRANRPGLLRTMSHEFFHAWNVERIRPRALEPFNLEDATVSGELWLAEGFTNYYGPLVLHRAGLTTARDFAREMGGMLNLVITSPGRRLRTAEEMSQLAPFVDAAAAIDPTNFGNTYISYYSWGAAIGIGLDLTLRQRSDGRITLDHFMRALWEKHGKPGGRMPGYVDNPYTIDDLRSVLAAVSGDQPFAADFFSRYIQGHEVVDYARLLAQAGFQLRSRFPGAASAGEVRFDEAGGRVRVAAPVPFQSPAYEAGLDRDDVVVAIGGTDIDSVAAVDRIIRGRKPGETVSIDFDRRGHRVTASLRLVEDPRLELIPLEDTGESLTAEHRRFREAWLGSQ
jgi:predicted metalloprotease with PDZ domain